MGRNWCRDDPERDAEDWASREDTRPVIDTCPVCHKLVRGESEDYEKDDAYEIDGWVLHADCVLKFLEKRGNKL